MKHLLIKSSAARQILAACLVALLAACGQGPEPAPEPSPELTAEQRAALTQRVTDYWRAMERKDFAAAYEFTTPNYRRIFSKDMFLNNFGYSLDWELTGVEVTHYDAHAAVASVAVRVMSKPTKPTSEASQIIGATPRTRTEKWILSEGDWWRSPRI